MGRWFSMVSSWNCTGGLKNTKILPLNFISSADLRIGISEVWRARRTLKFSKFIEINPKLSKSLKSRIIKKVIKGFRIRPVKLSLNWRHSVSHLHHRFQQRSYIHEYLVMFRQQHTQRRCHRFDLVAGVSNAVL